MLIRETTHAASTLSIDYGMVGRRLPILRTAAGRVYLAFCPDNERRAILDMLNHSAAPEDQFDARRLAALLRRIRDRWPCAAGPGDQPQDIRHFGSGPRKPRAWQRVDDLDRLCTHVG